MHTNLLFSHTGSEHRNGLCSEAYRFHKNFQKIIIPFLNNLPDKLSNQQAYKCKGITSLTELTALLCLVFSGELFCMLSMIAAMHRGNGDDALSRYLAIFLLNSCDRTNRRQIDGRLHRIKSVGRPIQS